MEGKESFNQIIINNEIRIRKKTLSLFDSIPKSYLSLGSLGLSDENENKKREFRSLYLYRRINLK